MITLLLNRSLTSQPISLASSSTVSPYKPSSSPMALTDSPPPPRNQTNPNSSPLNKLASDRITLVVENTRFIVNPELFTAKKDTMLYSMFHSSASLTKSNEKGEYEFEGFSATVFKAILVSNVLALLFFPFHCFHRFKPDIDSRRKLKV